MLVVIPTRVHDGARQQKVPVANGLLVALNVMCFFLGWQWHVGPGTGLLSMVGYGFSHASVTHLIFNMWVLLVFGNAVNRRLGNGYYLLTYLGTIVFLGIFGRMFSFDYLIGSSGGIFAVIAMFAMLLPSVLVEIGYIVVLPLTLLIGFFSRPSHWLFWLIRWDTCQLRGWWFILLVPIMQLMGLIWWSWNWTNLGHLVGFFCGIAAVLLLPAKISMRSRVNYGAS